MGIAQQRLETVAHATAQHAAQKLNHNTNSEKITSLYARLAYCITIKEECERQAEWYLNIAETSYADAERYSQTANKHVQLLLQAGVSSASIDTFIKNIPQSDLNIVEERDTTR